MLAGSSGEQLQSQAALETHSLTYGVKPDGPVNRGGVLETVLPPPAGARGREHQNRPCLGRRLHIQAAALERRC